MHTVASVATPLLATALSSRGENDATRRQIAELEKKQDWPALLKFAQQRMQLEPGQSDWGVVAGYALLRMEEYSQAAQSFTRATEASPEDIDAWNLLGETQRLMAQPDRAIRTLERATTIDRTSHVTRFLLGETYRESGMPTQAIGAYRESIRLEPQYSPAWFGLGSLYGSLGAQAEFDTVLQQLQKLSPALAAELQKKQAGNNSQGISKAR
jgi:tetratricopeptide (TPR) repeat protein